jgi:uroporphyrinogen decarboxylase
MNATRNSSPTSSYPFLQAALGQKPERAPVWIMRQAGRYLPDYRRVRALFPNFLDFCRSPEHVAEVTIQPVDQIGVDAAILFSDILVLLPAMGLPLEFRKGEGPVVDTPLRTTAAIDALPDGDLNVDLDYVFRGLALAKKELRGAVPLIGFAGGPFTVASYMVEGGSSKELAKLKHLMFSEPKAFHTLLSKLTNITGAYLLEQIRQGADAITIMDSWAGFLSPEDYREYVFPHTRAIIARLKAAHPETPVIHYANGASALLDPIVQLGADVVGLDWRISLTEAIRRHPGQVFQGNLDPCTLFAPKETVIAKAKALKKQVGSHPHIFNLGHGILPETPVENAQAFVAALHED